MTLSDLVRAAHAKNVSEGAVVKEEIVERTEELNERQFDILDAIEAADTAVYEIDDEAVVGAFEIESTTSIYSGILRMADLLSLQPNFQIDCYLVAPDVRESEVFNQVNRPTFVKMKKPFRETCRFIPFSRLIELSQSGFNALKHQKITYISEDFSDSLIPSEV